MKLREILEKIGDNNIYISFRMILTELHNCDIFIGEARYKDGEIISLDGDTWNLDVEYNKYYEEWFADDIHGVTVWLSD